MSCSEFDTATNPLTPRERQVMGLVTSGLSNKQVAAELGTTEVMHWGSSGFANTDLDLQLKQRGRDQVILIGLAANTCLETTGKFASELGYHVTLVRDATAAFSTEAMRVAHEINGPTYAHAILTTAELLAVLPKRTRRFPAPQGASVATVELPGHGDDMDPRARTSMPGYVA
jgi:Isochorismatase family/Bacterial regulatory proteins, luxR family